MKPLRAIPRALGSTRFGIALIIAFAIYAAMGSLPLFRMPADPPSLDAPRVTLRHLPWIDKSEGEYFAWWPAVSLLVAVVINMTVAMLTRVPRAWRKAPVYLTHAGVLLLALGSALYAAQKQEGEILLLAGDSDKSPGPPVNHMLDRQRVAVVYTQGNKPSAVIEVTGLPRFHARGGDRDPAFSLPAGLWQPESPTPDARTSGHVTAFRPSPQSPLSEDRQGSEISVRIIGAPRTVVQAPHVPFSRHTPQPVELATTPQPTFVSFSPLPVPMPGVSLALRDLTIDLIPGTDLARNVTAVVRTNTGEDRTITLNQPLALPALEPTSCDCIIRGTLERLWHRWINPVHWKFSIAGWDQEGWALSREAVIAGMTDRPRAGFLVLGVGTSPGVRLVAAGAIMLALGAAWALLVSTFGSRTRVPAIIISACAAAFSIASPQARAADAARPARSLDPVAPLRTLPVQWNGRVAPLDTVARDIVRAVSGRERAPSRADPAQPEDPLVTLLDLVLDPDAAQDRAIISTSAVRLPTPVTERPHGAGLPAFISAREAEEWIDAARMATGPQADAPTHRALAPLAERLSLARLGVRGLALIAPPKPIGTPTPADQDWIDAESALAPPPIAAAMERLRSVWRTSDTNEALLATNHLAQLLRAHNHDRYDRWRVWLETLINAAAPLKWAAWVYAFAALIAAIALIRRPTEDAGTPPASPWRHALFTLAWLLHATGFAARWVIAGRIPIQNQYESMLGLSLAAATLAGLFTLSAPRRAAPVARIVLTGANIVALIVLCASNALPIPGHSIEPEAAILGTATLLKYHVATVLVAYAFIALSGLAASGWLIARAIAPMRNDVLQPLAESLPPLTRLSFWTLAVGILLGALWADRSWGRWWAFDPKETWALITWLVYLIALHWGAGKPRQGTNTVLPQPPTSVLAALCLLGTLVMLWSWFGVNLLLPGLHAYAGS